jgi:glycerol-1-phosphate dehydrogenase [NAD(P)+]
MELPEKVVIGNNIINELGYFIRSLGIEGKVILVSGKVVKGCIAREVEHALKLAGLSYYWEEIKEASMNEVNRVRAKAIQLNASALIGIGGGKSVDVAKLSSSKAELSFVSVPTSASHDGIASPFASIKGMNVPHSVVAKPPKGVFVDLDVVAKAPKRLLKSGCGDLIAKITAVRDWELARDDKGEYFGKYSASLAKLSASIVMNDADRIGNDDSEAIRDVVEALISAGVAAGIAGSSRPCSGSEHLFSHALDVIKPNKGLHGERCGIGAIMMAKLQGLDWKEIKLALEKVGAPTRASEIEVSKDEIVNALLLAPKIRDRYTILNKVNLNKERAYELARSTGVI